MNLERIWYCSTGRMTILQYNITNRHAIYTGDQITGNFNAYPTEDYRFLENLLPITMRFSYKCMHQIFTFVAYNTT